MAHTGMYKTSLDTSSRTLFVREGGRMSTSNVELRNYVPLFGVTQSNVDLRNITSDCYLNIVVSSSLRHTLLLQHDAPNYVTPISSVMCHLC